MLFPVWRYLRMCVRATAGRMMHGLSRGTFYPRTIFEPSSADDAGLASWVAHQRGSTQQRVWSRRIVPNSHGLPRTLLDQKCSSRLSDDLDCEAAIICACFSFSPRLGPKITTTGLTSSGLIILYSLSHGTLTVEGSR